MKLEYPSIIFKHPAHYHFPTIRQKEDRKKTERIPFNPLYDAFFIQLREPSPCPYLSDMSHLGSLITCLNKKTVSKIKYFVYRLRQLNNKVHLALRFQRNEEGKLPECFCFRWLDPQHPAIKDGISSPLLLPFPLLLSTILLHHGLTSIYPPNSDISGPLPS